ncbi:MAG: Ig-like domain-containing protein [Prevotella sp.]|nr:Ig-like domain-containing protein [Prevotella sp.]
MRKRFVNHQLELGLCEAQKSKRQNVLNRILLALLAMMFLPIGAWGQESYFGINTSSGNTYVTDENAANIWGDGTMSYDIDNKILTLNGIDLTSTSNYFSDAFIAMVDNSKTLTIRLLGTNSVSLGDKASFFYGTSITFTTDTSNPGTLTINTVGSNNTGEDWGGVLFLNYQTSQSMNATYNNGLSLTQNGNTYTIQAPPASYDITVARIDVTSANASNVLNDNNSSVSYNASTNTLTLNGANIAVEGEGVGISYWGTDDLTICLKGNNTIQGSFCGAICGPEAKLIFTRGDTNPCSLQLTTTTANENDPNPVISGFSAIQGVYSIGDASISNALTLSDDDQVSYNSENGMYTGETSNPVKVSSAKIVDFYSLNVDDERVTSENASNILGNETATFTPAAGSTPATLTLNNLEDDCNITSGLDNLNVVLVGSNSVGNIVYGGAATTSSISFSGTGSMEFDATTVPYGFTNVTYGDNLAMKVTSAGTHEAHIITPLEAPVFWPTFNDKGQRVIEIRNYFTDATVTYSLTYANASLSTENKTDEPYTGGIILRGPATITTKATIGSKVSTVATAYHFGAETNPMTFTYGDSFTAPTLVPNVDGVSLRANSYESSVSLDGVATLNDANTSFSFDGIGKGIAYAKIDYPEQINYTVLNATDSLGFYIEVVPPEPAIAFDNTKTYLNTDNIEISIDGTYESYAVSNNITNIIYYSWDENPTTGTAYQEGGVAAQTGTLTAWVSSTKSGDTYRSEKTSQAFTVKTDISGYIVNGLSESASYTGTAIVPDFSVMASTTATASLTAGTDYTVSYKKVVKGDALTDVTSMEDAGSYKIVITGTGNYGGSISKDFEITRAYPWTATGSTYPEAKTGLAFTNEAQDLITGATVPDGVTVKYCYKYSTSEFGDAALSVLPDPANWTTTVPQGTNVGYYAVFYTVEGGTNYQDWGPCEVALQTPISPKVTTFTVLLANPDEVITYDGTAKTPAITVKDGNTVLNATTDYTITGHLNNINAATSSAATPPTVTIAGAGNYNGSTGTATFTINPKSIATATVSDVATQTYTYTGDAITPNATVSIMLTEGAAAATNLTAGTDFTITGYANNTNAATADSENAPTITITGTGNFTGTATGKFTIGQADFNVKIADIPEQDATGEPIEPQLTVTFKNTNNNVITVAASDYKADYSNNVNPGTATVILSSTGNNFKTELTQTKIFKINAIEDYLSIKDGEAFLSKLRVTNGNTFAIKDFYQVVCPEDIPATDLTWYSDDDNVVSVDNNGLITAEGYGNAKITLAYAGGGKYAEDTYVFYVDAAPKTPVISLPAGAYSEDHAAITMTKENVAGMAISYTWDDITGDNAATWKNYTDEGVVFQEGTLSARVGYTFTKENDTYTVYSDTVSVTYSYSISLDDIFASGQTFGTYCNRSNKTYKVLDGVKAYIVTGVSDNKVILAETKILPPNTAILLERGENVTAFSYTSATDADGTLPSGNLLKYATNSVSTSDKTYYVLYKDEFLKATGTIPAGKCYLDLSGIGAARAVYGISHNEGDDTGISNVVFYENGVEKWYDLQGRRIEKPTKAGLYIKNGNKVVIER